MTTGTSNNDKYQYFVLMWHDMTTFSKCCVISRAILKYIGRNVETWPAYDTVLPVCQLLSCMWQYMCASAWRALLSRFALQMTSESVQRLKCHKVGTAHRSMECDDEHDGLWG